MPISKNLISQFVKNTKDDVATKKETFAKGVIVYDEANKSYRVKIDGSDILTPVSITTNVNVDQPVTVMIKNHTATVIGNVSSELKANDSSNNVLNSTAVENESIPISSINALWE